MNNKCLFCNKNPARQKYCSRSCSNRARVGEKHIMKKKYQSNKTKKEYRCKYCNTIIRVGYSRTDTNKHCLLCRINPAVNKNYVDWSLITKKQLRDKIGITSQFHGRIRALARISKKKEPCVVCGYSTYIEICHIKPISEFNDDATIAEINHQNNLVCLCPNHHKELDLHLITLS